MEQIVYRAINPGEEQAVCDLVRRVFNEFVARSEIPATSSGSCFKYGYDLTSGTAVGGRSVDSNLNSG